MAGTMVHLVIADKLAEKWEGREINTPYGSIRFVYDYFIAGNICPDGIMARKNYVRDMKKHTHFRDGILDCDFHKEENLNIFRKRLNGFMEENLNLFKSDNERSLYLGYWTHMLTDEMFMLIIRPKFMENIAFTGLTQYDMETFKHFGIDTDRIDFRLANEYKAIKRIYNALKNIEAYEIHDMITKEELTDSRKWILGYFFETDHKDVEAPVYITYNDLLEFADNVTTKLDCRFNKG